MLGQIAAGKTNARIPATMLGLWFDDPKALTVAREIVADTGADPAARSEMLKAGKELELDRMFEGKASATEESFTIKEMELERLDQLRDDTQEEAPSKDE